MAREITISHRDGSRTVYRSTLFRGFHLKEASDGVCVTEKRWFEQERLVACYPNANASQVRCGICEAVNPTQRPDSV